MIELTEEDLERYSRHIILQDVDIDGQIKIMNSKILIIGAGGLGSPVALYLAAAGIGEIGIIDGDVVDLSNLQRQIIHTTNDINIPKVESAKAKMLAINPNIKVNTYNTMVNSTNILDLIKEYDFIIDGTDNFASKFLINDACVFANKPYSHGGILRFGGQTMTIKPNESACYACVFDSPPPKDVIPTCSTAGILGSVAGILGTIQATEALKYVVGIDTPLYNSLLSFDAKTMNFRKINLAKNPKCRVCGDNKINKLIDYEQEICGVK